MGQKNDPHYGEDTDHQPHMGEREEPKGRTDKETGRDKDDAKKSGMRPTGAGGGAPTPGNMEGSAAAPAPHSGSSPGGARGDGGRADDGRPSHPAPPDLRHRYRPGRAFASHRRPLLRG